MTWPADIERWRQFVVWEAKDIPADLVLAIIAHESAGTVGIPSRRPTSGKASAPMLLDSGQMSTAPVTTDLGLMQCTPALVNDWNAKQTPKATLEDMTGTDERAARLQIRIGSWYFAGCVAQLNRYAPAVFTGDTPGRATADQLRMALVCYARGWGALKPALDELTRNGRPLTYDELQAAQAPGSTLLKASNAFWRAYQAHAGGPMPAAAAAAPGAIVRRGGVGPAGLVPMTPIGPAGQQPGNGQPAAPKPAGDFDIKSMMWPALLILGAYLISRGGGLGGIFGGAKEEEEDERPRGRFRLTAAEIRQIEAEREEEDADAIDAEYSEP